MGVVDHDGEGLAGVQHLHPPAQAARRGQPLGGAVQRVAEGLADRQRAERVVDVEAPGQRQVDGEPAARALDVEADAVDARRDVDGAHVGRVSMP